MAWCRHEAAKPLFKIFRLI
ncbi:hypothetical protein YPPY99_0822, partial [Yersinia pestis PY-99]